MSQSIVFLGKYDRCFVIRTWYRHWIDLELIIADKMIRGLRVVHNVSDDFLTTTLSETHTFYTQLKILSQVLISKSANAKSAFTKFVAMNSKTMILNFLRYIH